MTVLPKRACSWFPHNACWHAGNPATKKKKWNKPVLSRKRAALTASTLGKYGSFAHLSCDCAWSHARPNNRLSTVYLTVHSNATFILCTVNLVTKICYNFLYVGLAFRTNRIAYFDPDKTGFHCKCHFPARFTTALRQLSRQHFFLFMSCWWQQWSVAFTLHWCDGKQWLAHWNLLHECRIVHFWAWSGLNFTITIGTHAQAAKRSQLRLKYFIPNELHRDQMCTLCHPYLLLELALLVYWSSYWNYQPRI